MFKFSWLYGACLAACLMLAGCFTSQAPLFDLRRGLPVMGAGAVEVTAHDPNGEPDTGVLTFEAGAYVDRSGEDDTIISFHRLPGAWPWSGWLIGETELNSARGKSYMYDLYRKRGNKLYVYDASCSDLTEREAAEAHLVRAESGQECQAARAQDIAEALRLLAKRKTAKTYWTFAPAKS